MNIQIFQPFVDNYRGHCVAVIANSYTSTTIQDRLIRKLPSEISYDQYVGLVGILQGAYNSNDIVRMYNKLFQKEGLLDIMFGWIDDVITIQHNSIKDLIISECRAWFTRPGMKLTKSLSKKHYNEFRYKRIICWTDQLLSGRPTDFVDEMKNQFPSEFAVVCAIVNQN